MKSKDYSNQVTSFTPLEPQQMIRVALVEGLKPQYMEGERQRYRRLLKAYVGVDERRIDQLFDIIGMEQSARTGSQKKFLNVLVNEVAYDARTWRPFDYDALRREGVVIDYSGSPSGLVETVLGIDESKVVLARDPVWVYGDYVKHLDWRNKSALNGPDVIIAFAQEKGFDLPESFLRYRRPTEEVYKLLEQHGFTYQEALRIAIKVLKDPRYANRVISALVTKHKNGSELRFHHHDFVEAAELLVYSHRHNKMVTEKVGDKATMYGNRYHGANQYLVPRRTPEPGSTHDTVEIHYLPDFQDPKNGTLEWMNTVVSCDCGNDLNLRNFEERRGRRTYVITTLDTHGGVVVLEIQRRKGINANKNPQNLNPLPTPEFSRFVDMLRYNIIQETEVQDEDRTKTVRTYVPEKGIEILINELAKRADWDFERMN